MRVSVVTCAGRERPRAEGRPPRRSGLFTHVRGLRGGGPGTRAAAVASHAAIGRPHTGGHSGPGSPPARGRRELAALDASPSWRLRDVLAGTPAQGGAPGSRRRVFLGETEFRGGATLAEIGATGGSELTLMLTPTLHVLTASHDLTAKIWHAESGQCLRTLEGHDGLVWSAVFSPDGLEVLTASQDGTARIWHAESGQCLHTLEGHHDRVYSAVFSPDGLHVLTASGDRTAKIWHAGSGQCLRTLEGHRGGVVSAVFSPDGLEVLTASEDGTARIWHAESGQCLHTLEGHHDRVNSAVFSPDGLEVLTASYDRTAKIWHAESGQCLRTLEGHYDPVFSAVFSPQ
ncbi:unnamed protein product [Prorocentrum cordatum]|uniref:WD40 repeat domain-containing protein n=1 Tax=Prorocentrum cordatum TaxID=2364126 RepID=A0ABN9T3F3_9DINO|nr:unnamed protein product [Polarella glacialis]